MVFWVVIDARPGVLLFAAESAVLKHLGPQVLFPRQFASTSWGKRNCSCCSLGHVGQHVPPQTRVRAKCCWYERARGEEVYVLLKSTQSHSLMSDRGRTAPGDVEETRLLCLSI